MMKDLPVNDVLALVLEDTVQIFIPHRSPTP